MDVTYDDLQDRRILALEREVARLRRSIEIPRPSPLVVTGESARLVEGTGSSFDPLVEASEGAPSARATPGALGPDRSPFDARMDDD